MPKEAADGSYQYPSRQLLEINQTITNRLDQESPIEVVRDVFNTLPPIELSPAVIYVQQHFRGQPQNILQRLGITPSPTREIATYTNRLQTAAATDIDPEDRSLQERYQTSTRELPFMTGFNHLTKYTDATKTTAARFRNRLDELQTEPFDPKLSKEQTADYWKTLRELLSEEFRRGTALKRLYRQMSDVNQKAFPTVGMDITQLEFTNAQYIVEDTDQQRATRESLAIITKLLRTVPPKLHADVLWNTVFQDYAKEDVLAHKKTLQEAHAITDAFLTFPSYENPDFQTWITALRQRYDPKLNKLPSYNKLLSSLNFAVISGEYAYIPSITRARLGDNNIAGDKEPTALSAQGKHPFLDFIADISLTMLYDDKITK